MSIDASVAYVECKEDGSGTLHLCDRIARPGQTDGIAGQRGLHFDAAPYEVTALNGLAIWGGSSSIMLGDKEIARRIGYTRISFTEREQFLEAVKLYHHKRRQEILPHE